MTARNTVVVHQRLSRHHDVQVVETNRRGHATRFAQDAAMRGLDAVVAYGGDGTLNEVATGVAGSDTALAVLPGGSTNVFARTLGMPNDALQSVDLIIEALGRGDIKSIGLGKVNGRYFTFHTGVGYDAAVVKRVEQRAALKRYAGHPLFVIAALRTWAFDYDRRQPHFTVDIGGAAGTSVPGAFFTIVMNTNPYTYLGPRPFDLVPSTDLTKGLSVVTFTSMNATKILRSVGTALRGGGVSTNSWLDVQSNVSEVRVAHDRAFPYQMDGDYLGEVKELRFEHVPDAVRLVQSFPQQ